MNESEVAKNFWCSTTKYPSSSIIKERRFHELSYLLPKLRGKESLLDLGCGYGDLIITLHSLTELKKYYAYDFSERMLEPLRRINFSDTQINVVNLLELKDLPTTDVSILGGVIPYIFDDKKMLNLFKSITSEYLYVRAPCSMDKESLIVNSYSEDIGTRYASYYRTVSHIEENLSQTHEILTTLRIYPDAIESKFGTRQFYFEARRK